ncbi:MAG TPA: acyltransferase [Chthoniobacterales bacterium]
MDGLRAVAVISVLIHHFEANIPQWINWGTLGVRFFFVMSGFLITRILLKSREKADTGQSSGSTEFWNFQMRRLIRTMPPYYLAIAIAATLAIPPVRETLAWTLSFCTNFLIVQTSYFPLSVSHYWSIAVQEQFYLIWPFLIFFLPKSWFKATFAILIVAAVLFRLACIQMQVSDVTRWVSLPGSLDTFAIGGILAYVSMSHPRLLENSKTRLWTGLAAFSLAGVARGLRMLDLHNPWTVLIETFEATFMAWVVACSVTGFKGVVGWILSSPPMTHIGKVSYGIYVYHVLIVILIEPWLEKIGLGHHANDPFRLRFMIQVTAVVAVASVSWHFFEQPMLKARDWIAGWLQNRHQEKHGHPAGAEG